MEVRTSEAVSMKRGPVEPAPATCPASVLGGDPASGQLEQHDTPARRAEAD